MAAQAVFLGCGLIAFGLIFVIAGVIQLRSPLGSLRWPAADGEITSSALQPVGDDRSRFAVRFQYTVRGQTFSGSRRSFQENVTAEGASHPNETAAALAARYPPGKPVKVYYDPLHPDRSVLEPGTGLAAYAPLALGGLFFITGLIVSMFAFI